MVAGHMFQSSIIHINILFAHIQNHLKWVYKLNFFSLLIKGFLFLPSHAILKKCKLTHDDQMAELSNILQYNFHSDQQKKETPTGLEQVVQEQIVTEFFFFGGGGG